MKKERRVNEGYLFPTSGRRAEDKIAEKKMGVKK